MLSLPLDLICEGLIATCCAAKNFVFRVARPSATPQATRFLGGDSAMNTIPHYIGGKRVEGTSGRSADVFNPATGEVQAQMP